MKNILLTGGAGYIGSHNLYLLCNKGFNVIVFDNLYRGYKQVIDVLSDKFLGKITFVNGDLKNADDIKKAFESKKIDAVMHFAALCLVAESVEKPQDYYMNNVVGSLNLLNCMREYGVNKIVFSSTCATYGDKEYLPIDENHPQNPVNSYGSSKFMVEKILSDYNKSYGIEYVIFRYFNVCGASDDGLIGDSKKPSVLLVQNAVRGALDISPFYFTCPKVDTPDGTTIRDYVDVNDLANSHILGVEYLLQNGKSDVFNIGSGKGYSTKEIVDKVEEFTGKKFKRNIGEARKGESPVLYADINKIQNTFGWKVNHSLEDSIKNLIKWYTDHPNGWDY